jgi:hypothetical protein
MGAIVDLGDADRLSRQRLADEDPLAVPFDPAIRFP